MMQLDYDYRHADGNDYFTSSFKREGLIDPMI
jgi:hypothetical protein